MTQPPRRPAPHVATALAAAQAKPAPAGASASRAPHVQAALGAAVQPRQPVPPAPRPPAPHVQAALARPAQLAPPLPRPAPAGAIQRALAPRSPIVPLPRVPARGVVQLAAFNYATVDPEDPNASAHLPGFAWDEYGDWLVEQERRRSSQPKPVVVIPPRVQIGPSGVHLDAFHKKADAITEEDPASYVLFRGSVNGKEPKPDNSPDLKLEKAITKPKETDAVNDSVEDGEVQPLIRWLKAFRAYLQNPLNSSKDQNFELSLAGSHGACDGCKQRISRFVELWAAAADAVMEKGTTARLRLTYRYLVPHKGFPRKWGKNYYGWAEDGDTPPLLHTIEATVRGEN